MRSVREGLPRVECRLMWNLDEGAEGEEVGGQDKATAALSVGGGIPISSPHGAVQDQDHSWSRPGFGSSGSRTEHLHRAEESFVTVLGLSTFSQNATEGCERSIRVPLIRTSISWG